jgi:Cdc6-like AAA superfamily ATPase
MSFEVAKLDAEVTTEMAKVRAVVDLPELLDKAKSLDIVDDGSYGLAGEFVKQIRTALRNSDEERKKITGPLNKSIQAINGMYKQMVEPLEKTEALLRTCMENYAYTKRQREEAEARKAQEILLAAAEKAEKEDKPELAQAALEVAVKIEDKPTAPVKTERATTSSRKIFGGFVIEDMAAVPDAFKIVDERKVREAYQSGVRSIPGLKIVERESVVVR